MATSRRTLVRESLLALIVAYLRDGVTTTGSFCLDPAVAGRYPFAPLKVFTFSLNSELWQVTIAEDGQAPLTPGLTIEFFGDRATPSKAMPQQWTLGVRFRIRVPQDWNGEATAEEIAQKIDEALFRSNGQAEIKDYQQNPAATTNNFLTWMKKPRGDWEWVNAGVPERRLTMEMSYTTPNL